MKCCANDVEVIDCKGQTVVVGLKWRIEMICGDEFNSCSAKCCVICVVLADEVWRY